MTQPDHELSDPTDTLQLPISSEYWVALVSGWGLFAFANLGLKGGFG